MDKVNKEELIEATIALIEAIEENKYKVWRTFYVDMEEIEGDIKHLKKILGFKDEK